MKKYFLYLAVLIVAASSGAISGAMAADAVYLNSDTSQPVYVPPAPVSVGSSVPHAAHKSKHADPGTLPPVSADALNGGNTTSGRNSAGSITPDTGSPDGPSNLPH